MGGAVSAGQNNDELIDNLMEADYIKHAEVERVFRAVDRAEYYLPQHRENSYKDLAWKHGNLHISAPCIYAEVLEALRIENGLSFLNLGSGTGYLSTLVGLLIGPNGLNHGVEFYEDVIVYAYERLNDFRMKNSSFDEFEFCEPVFFQGNGLSLSSGCPLYDRVYVGASCPAEHENYMKNLIKVGGVLVMPLNDQLLQIVRVSELQWETKHVLPVSFASLIQPEKEDINFIDLPIKKPLLLQEICRVAIRKEVSLFVRANHIFEKRSRPAKKKKVKRDVLRCESEMPAVFRHIVMMQRRFQAEDNNGSRRSSSEEMSDDEGVDDCFTDDKNPAGEIFLEDKCLDTLIEEPDTDELGMESEPTEVSDEEEDVSLIDLSAHTDQAEDEQLLQYNTSNGHRHVQYSAAITMDPKQPRRQTSDPSSISTSSTSGIGSYGSFDTQQESPPMMSLLSSSVPEVETTTPDKPDTDELGMESEPTEVSDEEEDVSLIDLSAHTDQAEDEQLLQYNTSNGHVHVLYSAAITMDPKQPRRQTSDPSSISTSSTSGIGSYGSFDTQQESPPMMSLLSSSVPEVETTTPDSEYVFDGDKEREDKSLPRSDVCPEEDVQQHLWCESEHMSSTSPPPADHDLSDDVEDESTTEDSEVKNQQPDFAELLSKYIHSLPVPQALRQYLLFYRN